MVVDVVEATVNPVVGWYPLVVIGEVNEFFVGDALAVDVEAGEASPGDGRDDVNGFGWGEVVRAGSEVVRVMWLYVG